MKSIGIGVAMYLGIGAGCGDNIKPDRGELELTAITGVDYGEVLNGTTSPARSFRVTNTGLDPTGDLTTTLEGAGFAIVNDTCTAPLPPDGTCTIDVTFSPTSAVSSTAVLTVSDSLGSEDAITISGTGIVDTSMPPVAVADAVDASEDVALSFDVLANDTDADGGPMMVTAVTQPANGTVSINTDGTLRYQSNANVSGADSFMYTLNGGSTATVTLNVRAVNDAPAFTVGANQSILEDAGARSVAAWATAISSGPADESAQALTFTVTGNTNAALFSAGPAISSTGTLTYTPAAHAFGTATITVTLSDNGGTALGGVNTSAAQTFTITVAAVNDAPSFLVGPDQVRPANTSGAQMVNPWATNIAAGPANEAAQVVTFEIIQNTNPGMFTVQPAVSSTGVLTYTPAGDGVATIRIRIVDNGGTANGGVAASPTQSFVIRIGTVVPVPPPGGINLRSLSTFVAVAGAGLTSSNSSGITTLGGDVGLYPTATCMSDGSICSLDNPRITGTLYAADAGGVAMQAKIDLGLAYVDAQAKPPGTTVNDLSGMVLAPGVYTSASTMSIAVGGTVTLDGQNNANAVWVFQIGSSLTVNNNAQILLINGANAANVYWAAGASSTLGSNVNFKGTVMADASNSVGTDSVVVGRLLSMTGMVTLLSNTITLP